MIDINSFFSEIISNLQIVGIVFLIFSFGVLSNIFSSCYYNTHNLKQELSLSRFLNGILKMFVIGISTGILAIIASILPYILSLVGITMPEDTEDIYTIVAIFTLYANGIIKYYKEAYNTLKDIIINRNIIEDTKSE